MTHNIRIVPKGLEFRAKEDETILDAAARDGIRMRKSCDNGICEICKATLLGGSIHTPQGTMDAQHEEVNPMLPCVSRAASDLLLEQKHVLGPGEISLQHIAFQVQQVSHLGGNVYQLDLLAPAGKLANYHAGQYLELIIDDQHYPFTIASAPGQRELELHLGVNDDNPTSQMILNYFQNNGTVRARVPMGQVWLKPNVDEFNLHDPLVFIVAGTGFAQAKAMIEEQMKHQHSAMYLYWINPSIDGFYSQLPQQWAQQHVLQYTAMTPESPDCEYYTPHTVETLIQDQLKNLDNVTAVICGGPGFVYSVLAGLESKGMKQSQTLSDVYAYAPRPE